ncbi:hypothetical protein MTBBW1_350045 [Desulfamplus magnetovallimortis]|uniref:Uncharacterized protein n=1 Tax=Desulfamplus magnetovallimortis TaxID=1246637 RepID=A0A1W1HGF4_9BACT|nr:hypothetical protein MTBBW1_350045 [Desulfamplus magnetovallimortis]
MSQRSMKALKKNLEIRALSYKKTTMADSSVMAVIREIN